MTFSVIDGVVETTLDGIKYTFKDGKLGVAGKFENPTREQVAKARQAFAKSFEDFVAKGSHDAETLDAVKSALDVLSADGLSAGHTDKHLVKAKKLFEESNTLGTKLQTVAAKDAVISEDLAKELTTLMASHPGAEKLLPPVSANILNLGEGAERFKAIRKAATELRGSADALLKLHERGQYLEKDVEAIFAGAHSPSILLQVLKNEGGHGIEAFKNGVPAKHGTLAVESMNLETIASRVETNLVPVKNAADEIATQVAILEEKLASKWNTGGIKKDLETEGKKLAKLMEDYPGYEGHINKVLAQKLTAEQIASVKSAAPTLGAALGKASSGAASAGEKGPGIIERTFKVTIDSKEQALKAARESGSAEKIAKAEKMVIGDLRKGRVAAAVGLTLAGGLLVKQALTAGTGHAGPAGERARETMRDSRDMGTPELAGGRA